MWPIILIGFIIPMDITRRNPHHEQEKNLSKKIYQIMIAIRRSQMFKKTIYQKAAESQKLSTNLLRGEYL